jgi:hypothetical protein
LASPEDKQRNQWILDITKELCVKLGIFNYNPTFISWETLDSRRRRPVEFAPDDCLLERWCVTLPGSMREVLEPEDWRPIIASALIFSKKLRSRVIRIMVISAMLLLAIAGALYLLLPTLLPQTITSNPNGGPPVNGTLGAYVALPLGAALVVMGTTVVTVILARGIRSQADREAAEVVGAATFLATLNKIAKTNRVNGGTRRGYVGGPVPLLPSLQDRIVRIQEYAGQG